MERLVGTVTRGIRCPIIREGDDLATIVADSILAASEQANFSIENKDIIGITESVVARAQGNYASIDDIATSVNNLVSQDSVALLFPILSRNRFSILLKGIARTKKHIILVLSFPNDEVGNELFPNELMEGTGINPYSDTLTLEEYRNTFGYNVHPFTKMDYVKYYQEIIENEGAKATILFSNNPKAVEEYTDAVIACDVHTRFQTKRALQETNINTILGLDDILTTPIHDSGYNIEFGLLGSNKATEDSIKLFPNDPTELVEEIQNIILNKTGKLVEVMVYGDGAFKDPKGKIWELADPTVSPAYTKGLEGTPNELKLKYLADNDFKDLSGDALKEAIYSSIKDKKEDLQDNMAAQGTTPRQLVDLIGSLCDLTSGSGDKGTPIVYIQGYFDNYISE